MPPGEINVISRYTLFAYILFCQVKKAEDEAKKVEEEPKKKSNDEESKKRSDGKAGADASMTGADEVAS
ncbi:hypothetical protein DM02DRAFT_667286 [Periconia macrospinosa]|uniref:Uncharacterized protein n=1 Tax=Periconia macrospinosa TaxID=97972 RepID=A0A2V1E873_9PLEO|nr:hypothetical protein DM02DRAFT_667286 [Periconia macrospinosa]